MAWPGEACSSVSSLPALPDGQPAPDGSVDLSFLVVIEVAGFGSPAEPDGGALCLPSPGHAYGSIT